MSAETAKQDASKVLSTQEKVVHLSLVEEDDDFEDFCKDDWQVSAKDMNTDDLWDLSWDDTIAEDDFSVLLKKELFKNTKMDADK
ncbi:hypothetical protein EV182_002470 [Spiromyces aspiralis]|uniref:Uncharacterized protein n=1 Tax=Spiromyces aspiralis TaxID=68401 RepID=A0ACC1HRR0_9FUNG|nr:hypothetical protein EV182_002470 [Spiromyces aspiralis]